MIECMRKKAKKPEYGQWIPVSDRLPEPYTEREDKDAEV